MRGSLVCQSLLTPRSSHLRSTGRSGRRLIRRRSSGTAGATRWTRPATAGRWRRSRRTSSGADMIMVKPALPYLDLARAAGSASTCRWRPTT